MKALSAPHAHDDLSNAAAGAVVLAAAQAAADLPVLAANVAEEPRSRVTVEREAALLGRDVDGAW